MILNELFPNTDIIFMILILLKLIRSARPSSLSQRNTARQALSGKLAPCKE
jgi:hypothetical protein